MYHYGKMRWMWFLMLNLDVSSKEIAETTTLFRPLIYAFITSSSGRIILSSIEIVSNTCTQGCVVLLSWVAIFSHSYTPAPKNCSRNQLWWTLPQLGYHFLWFMQKGPITLNISEKVDERNLWGESSTRFLIRNWFMRK